MKKKMTFLSLIVVVFWIVTSAPAWSQGKGGGQRHGGGAKVGSGQGPGTGQGPGASQGQARGAGDQTRQRIHLTSAQQDCLAAGTGIAARARQQAKDMAAGAGKAGFDAGTATRSHDALRGQIRDMLHEHDRMVGGFAAADRSRLETRLGKLDRVRSRIETHLQAMGKDLQGYRNEPAGFSRRARELERDLKAWQRQYGKLRGRLEVEAG